MLSAPPDWLVDNFVQSVVEWLVGALVAGGTAVLTTALLRRGKIVADAGEGRTCQSPEVFVVGALCAAVALGCLVWGWLDPQSLREPGGATAWWLLIVGFSLGFLVMTIYAQHRWRWDDAGLKWSGAFRKVQLAWPMIRTIGRSWDGQFFARDERGRTIRWTTYTLEHRALAEAVARRTGLPFS